MLESGAGSEPRKPLGFSMVGGLVLNQILTPYPRPVVSGPATVLALAKSNLAHAAVGRNDGDGRWRK